MLSVFTLCSIDPRPWHEAVFNGVMTEFNGLSWTRLSMHKTLISALPLTCITKVTHTPLLSTDNFTCAAQIQQTKDFFPPAFIVPFLSLAALYTFPTASLPLRNRCKRKILFPALSPSTPFSCIFCSLAAVYLCLM